MRVCGVVLVGCGTVGGGTAGILTEEAGRLERQTGTRFELKAVVDKDLSHARALGLNPSLFRDNADAVWGDPAVDVVVELAGGTGFAKTLVERALNSGKHVVTANKALLAEHGRELFALARRKGLTIGFEASCAGAIPIVRGLAENLVANRVTGLAGILNGTCNAILTDMGRDGLDYGTALKRAQEAGYAEADPFLDVSGTDTAHKLSLLASVGLGIGVDWKSIPLKGVEAVEAADHRAAARHQARIKLLARAEKRLEGWFLSVEPTVVPLPQPLAALEGPFNGVQVTASEAGSLYLQGRGAGARPTASAVVADLAALASGTAAATQRDYACWPDLVPRVTPLPPEAAEGPWFVHQAGEGSQIVTEGRRAAWESKGFRVFPWFAPG